MNKKGIAVLVVLIVLAVIAYMAFKGSDSVTPNTENNGTETPTETPSGVTKEDYTPVTKESTDTSLLGRLKSASVSASESGARVALENGTAKFSEGNVKGTLTLGDVAVEKEVGGAKYVVTSLAVNSGGSGTYKYVVLFEDSGSALTDKSYALVGDRVTITGIRVDVVSDNKGAAQIVVSVNYLDRDQGEPMSAAPTIPRTKIFIAEDGNFNPAKEITI